MVKIKLVVSFFAFFVINILLSQTIEIKGNIIAKNDIENIHVINKTSNKFTTTNKLGGFVIQA